MTERKFAPNRYRKQSGFCLDYDSGGYLNTHGVLDGDKETGITVAESGHCDKPDSHKRTISFKDKEYPLLRDAIFAYEDELAAQSENVSQ